MLKQDSDQQNESADSNSSVDWELLTILWSEELIIYKNTSLFFQQTFQDKDIWLQLW